MVRLLINSASYKQYYLTQLTNLTILLCLLSGCANTTPPSISPQPATNEAALKDLEILASDTMQGRKPGSSGHEAARNFITTRFHTLGLKAFSKNYQQVFSFSQGFQQQTGYNLIGWLEGTEFAETFIVITAHYDHLGKLGRKTFNGADDNASGVATLLALATHFAQYPPKHSLIFVATDAEEGGLHGADAFVSAPPVKMSSIVLNINLDMLGVGGKRGQLHALPAKGQSITKAWLKQQAPRYNYPSMTLRIGTPVPTRTLGVMNKVDWHKASDHASFADVGIPYIYFGTDVHAHYHQTSDSFTVINHDFFSAALHTVKELLISLDDSSYSSTGLTLRK